MKILVMGFTKLKYMPYMNFYLENIGCETNEVHLLYWNRDGKEEIALPFPVSLHEFHYLQEDDVPKYQKLGGFVKYRSFALELLKAQKFDFIVVLHSLPGVLVSGYLTRHYRNRFILDYRDFTYENLSFFKKTVHKLVNASYATFVSSNAFRSILPPACLLYTSFCSSSSKTV